MADSSGKLSGPQSTEGQGQKQDSGGETTSWRTWHRIWSVRCCRYRLSFHFPIRVLHKTSLTDWLPRTSVTSKRAPRFSLLGAQSHCNQRFTSWPAQPERINRHDYHQHPSFVVLLGIDDAQLRTPTLEPRKDTLAGYGAPPSSQRSPNLHLSGLRFWSLLQTLAHQHSSGA